MYDPTARNAGLGQDDTRSPRPYGEPILVPKLPKFPGDTEASLPVEQPAGIPLWLLLAGFGALLYATDERPTRRRKPAHRPVSFASLPAAGRQSFLMLGAAEREGCRDEDGKFIPVPQCTGRIPPGVKIEIVEKKKAVKKPTTKFKVGDQVKVPGAYRGQPPLTEGEVTEVKALEPPTGKKGVLKNYYQIGGRGLYAEDIVKKARGKPAKAPKKPIAKPKKPRPLWKMIHEDAWTQPIDPFDYGVSAWIPTGEARGQVVVVLPTLAPESLVQKLRNSLDDQGMERTGKRGMTLKFWTTTARPSDTKLEIAAKTVRQWMRDNQIAKRLDRGQPIPAEVREEFEMFPPEPEKLKKRGSPYITGFFLGVDGCRDADGHFIPTWQCTGRPQPKKPREPRAAKGWKFLEVKAFEGKPGFIQYEADGHEGSISGNVTQLTVKDQRHISEIFHDTRAVLSRYRWIRNYYDFTKATLKEKNLVNPATNIVHNLMPYEEYFGMGSAGINMRGIKFWWYSPHLSRRYLKERFPHVEATPPAAAAHEVEHSIGSSKEFIDPLSSAIGTRFYLRHPEYVTDHWLSYQVENSLRDAARSTAKGRDKDVVRAIHEADPVYVTKILTKNLHPIDQDKVRQALKRR